MHGAGGGGGDTQVRAALHVCPPPQVSHRAPPVPHFAAESPMLQMPSRQHPEQLAAQTSSALMGAPQPTAVSRTSHLMRRRVAAGGGTFEAG